MSLAYPDGMLIRYNTDVISAPITDGLVILADGTIYCAGEGTYVQSRTTFGLKDTYTLRSFKRVASSAGVAGANTMKGCIAQSY